MTTSVPRNRIFYFDLIRAYAIFLVVFSHIFAPLVWSFNSLHVHVWLVMNFCDALIRPCVPLFVMISGALILSSTREESITDFLKKRLSKILIPLLIWSLIYGLYQAYAGEEVFSFKKLLLRGLQEPIQYHLWFIYMLLGLYFVVPLLRIFTRHAKRSDLKYFLIVWFFSTSLPIIATRAFGFEFDSMLFLLTGYVGYFVLGYFLSTVNINSLRLRVALVGTVALTLFSFLGTYLLVIRNQGNMDEYLYQYLAPNTIVLSTCMFLILKSLASVVEKQNLGPLQWLVSIISKNSFGIYLMHMLILNILASDLLGFTLTESTIHPYIGVPLTTVAVIGISTLLTVGIQKIPFLRIAIPG